jgi:hypothetical protein
LGLVDLPSTKIESGILTKIKFNYEILAHANVQAHIRQSFLKRNIADPIPVQSIHALWTSIFGAQSTKAKEFFDKRSADIQKSKSVPYRDVEDFFLRCLAAIEELAPLSQKQLEALAPEEEVSSEESSVDADENKMDDDDDDDDVVPQQESVDGVGSTHHEEEEEARIEEESRLQQEETRRQEEALLAEQARAKARAMIEEVENQRLRLADEEQARHCSTTDDAFSIEGTTAAATVQQPSSVDERQSADEEDGNAAVEELVQRIEELDLELVELTETVGALMKKNSDAEGEIARLTEMLTEAHRRQGSVVSESPVAVVDGVAPNPSQKSTSKLEQENKILRQRHKTMVAKYERALQVINSLEVERAVAVVAARVDTSQYMLDSVVINDDEVMEF